jgi:hypothetical protein
MIINIDKRFFSLRLKYDILVDGVQEFIAKSDIFHVPYKPQLTLYDLAKNEILFINLASNFFFKHDSVFINEEHIELIEEDNDQDILYFYYQGHKHTIHFSGNASASIFKYNEKVADFINEQKFGDYIITCYNDTYKLIAIAIVLAHDFSIQKSSIPYH